MSRTRLVALLLVLGTLAVYLPTAQHGFSTFDDGDYVTGNSIVQSGLTWAGVRWAFTTWHASNWHPLTWLSHMLDCQLLGLNPGSFHVINVLFHVANTVLVFVLLRKWVNAFWPPALAAALFAWHPMHVESVAWISERKDVLSTFFALLALLSYTRYAQKPEARSRKSEVGSPTSVISPLTSGFWYPASVFFFACALLSKPMFVTLPFVMLLVDYWPLGRVQSSRFKVQGLVLEKIPLLLISAASCLVTFLAQNRGGMVMSLERVPLVERLVHVPVNYVLYLSKLFWPEHLAIYYPLVKIETMTLAISVAILVLISLGVWLARKNYPYLLVGWLWFLGTLVPVIGLVQVGAAAIADRYTYFPSIGLFLALTLAVADIARRFKLSRAVVAVPAVVVLAALLWLTHVQLTHWRNDIALYSHALEVTKDDGTLRLCLGLAYEKAGRHAEAVTQYEVAVKLDPQRARAHSALANALANGDQPPVALPEFQEALRLDPNNVSTHNNLGMLFMRLNRFDDATNEFSRSMQLDPYNWRTPFLMAQVRLKQGQTDEAITLLQRALQDDPGNPFVLKLLADVRNIGSPAKQP